MGQAPFTSVVPAFPPNSVASLDQTDFSMEFWVLVKTGGGAGGRFGLGGILSQAATPVFHAGLIYYLGGAGSALNLDFNGYYSDNVGSSGVNNIACPKGWFHVAMNVDWDPSIDGTLEIFVNGVSAGTDFIDRLSFEGNIPVTYFYPLIAGNSTQGFYDGYEGGPATTDIFPVCLGPTALHSRLLTTTEIQIQRS